MSTRGEAIKFAKCLFALDGEKEEGVLTEGELLAIGRMVEGLTYRQISREMGVSTTRVAYLIRKGFRKYTRFIKCQSRSSIILDEDLLQRHVEALNLPRRAQYCLLAAGIDDIGSLVRKTEAELLRTKNFGQRALKEIKAALADLNLRLGM